MKKLKKLSFYLLIIFLISACKKNKNTAGVPYVEVNFTLNLADPELLKLQTVGNWEYITGGSKGIVVYRVSNEEFVAYDRNCTFDIFEICSQLDVDVTNLKLNDYDCCGSEFSIMNGSVLKGPATLPMKAYNTTFDGNIITITN